MTLLTSFIRTYGAAIALSGSLFFLFTPAVYAASVSFEAPDHPPAGVPFTITVKFSAGVDTVNAVDGAVLIPPGLDVKSVSTGASIMTLWPVGPLYVASDRKIEFTGGVPGGLAKKTEGTLFTFTVVAPDEGLYKFSSSRVSAYRNDGTGARIPAPASAKTVTVSSAGEKASSATGPSDTKPPVFSAVAVGHDESLFDNKYFVTFFATDADSGIDHYEVREGWFGSYVRADRYYVLQDQGLTKNVTVRAVDKAGNATTKTLPAEHPESHALIYVVTALIILAVGVYVYRRRRMP